MINATQLVTDLEIKINGICATISTGWLKQCFLCEGFSKLTICGYSLKQTRQGNSVGNQPTLGNTIPLKCPKSGQPIPK